MRTTREEKQKTSQRIVEGAARLVRERGIEATSVADVMSAAGLTHGGFYRHFEDKDALMVAALEAAFAERLAALDERFDAGTPAEAVAGYQAEYLHDGHVTARAIACPLPLLGGDVGRAGDTLKATYGASVRQLIDSLERGMPGSPEERRAQAVRRIAMLVGAVTLARASDPETGRMILAACRE